MCGKTLFSANRPESEKKILCFGEILIRIGPLNINDDEWLNKNIFPFDIGGAEANVAIALALWNVPSSYLTATPDNWLSKQLIKYLESKNIDVSNVRYQGDKIGLLYLPYGSDMKNAGVIYDRNYSSFSQFKPGSIDWDVVFEGIEWFHFSAISPALNQSLADVCEEALTIASKKGIHISVDLNYREKLWKYNKQPHKVMPNLIKYCDLIMGNIWAEEIMLGIPVNKNLRTTISNQDYVAESKKFSETILKLFPKIRAVANTFRFDNTGDEINYFTTLYTRQSGLISSKEYKTKEVINKVGSGDCFMAGIIYGYYNNLSIQQTLEFATAAAFKKLFVPSDSTTISKDEIQKFMIEK